MKLHRKFKLPICILLSLILYSNECKAQSKPWTLRGCMRFLNRNMDDTTKYDFMMSPFDYCYSKYGFGSGFRNSMGLWKFNPLTLHFKLRGIRHPDDMSSIIKQSFYRYLNNEPIEFSEQKKKYKKYWSEIKKGNNSGDVYNELWEKNAIPDSIKKNNYVKLFHAGRKVKGYFSVINWPSSTSFQDDYVHYIAEIIEINDSSIKILVQEVGLINKDFEFADTHFKEIPKKGDILEVDPCLVYLIPD